MTLTMRVFCLDAKKMKFSLSGWGLIFGSNFFQYVFVSKESLLEI